MSGNVRAEMNTKRAAVALHQDLEIASGLGRLDHAERVFCPGTGKSTASSHVICRKTPVLGPPL